MNSNILILYSTANQTATKSNQRHHVVPAHIVPDPKSQIIITNTASTDIPTKNITSIIRQQNKTKAIPVLIKMHSKISPRRSIMTTNHMIHSYSLMSFSSMAMKQNGKRQLDGSNMKKI